MRRRDPGNLETPLARSCDRFTLGAAGRFPAKDLMTVRIFLFFTLLLFVACGKKPVSETREARPVPIRTGQAIARDVPVYIDETGATVASETVSIRAQVSGVVTSVEFTEGAKVEKGTVLFRLDDRPFRTEYDKAVAVVERNQAALELAVSQKKRAESLSRDRVIAQQEVESALSQFKGATAQILSDKASVEAARLNLEYCTIRTPLTGRTGKHLVDAGNLVQANGDPLVIIQAVDPLYVDFAIPESKMPGVREQIKSGELKLVVTAPADPKSAREGVLRFLDTSIRQGTGTLDLRGVIPNEDHMFWPGQFVHVRLILRTLKDAVLIPSSAIQLGQESDYVFVVKEDQTVDLRDVKTGQRQGDLIVVEEGISPGETVVTSGQLSLAPGVRVNDVGAEESAAGAPAK